MGFISLALTPATDVEFMDDFYAGLYDSAHRHQVALIGGDTTHGRDMVVNLALLGDVEKGFVRLRSHAVPGDLICATGDLGRSQAGLKLLLNDRRDGYLKGHLEPQCRLEREGKAIARHAHAMIDVSDGLASEVRHICEESATGACIYWDKIPVSKDTVEAAALISGSAQNTPCTAAKTSSWCSPYRQVTSLPCVKSSLDFTIVGEILPMEEGIHIIRNGRKEEMKKGYDHFAA